MRSLAVATCWICLGMGLAAARTYHVARNHPKASDHNPGTADAPWKTISRAAEVLGPGDTVLIHEGTYRERVTPPRSGTFLRPITYQAAKPGAVVITGADVITGWTRVDDHIWKKTPWPHKFPTHPNDRRHRLIGRCEQVIADGRLLRQVETPSEMAPGTFCADTAAKVLYVWLPDGSDPNAHAMEASVRPVCFGITWGGEPRNHIRLRGITIRYAANMAQRGALSILGDNWRVEDCVVAWTNGTGIAFRGDHITIRRVRSHHNGQQGLGGGGQRFRLEEVILDHNNLKGFAKGWEAGGMKIALARQGIVARCQAIANNGNGLWFDIDIRDVVVEQCLCRDNAGSGIFVEISGDFRIRDNLCVRNGTDDQWGMAGILVAESDNCTIEHNTCILNPTGIAIREQGPRSFKGRDGSQVTYRVRDITIRRNILALNRRYQFGLWSDNVFFGPHPSAEVGARGTPYDPDQCNIRLDHNLYWKDGKAALALWGCPWRPKHRVYADLATWQSERGQDGHSLLARPRFVLPEADNWRLMPESPGTALSVGPRRFPAGTDPASFDATGW